MSRYFLKWYRWEIIIWGREGKNWNERISVAKEFLDIWMQLTTIKGRRGEACRDKETNSSLVQCALSQWEALHLTHTGAEPLRSHTPMRASLYQAIVSNIFQLLPRRISSFSQVPWLLAKFSSNTCIHYLSIQHTYAPENLAAWCEWLKHSMREGAA